MEEIIEEYEEESDEESENSRGRGFEGRFVADEKDIEDT